MHKKKSLFQHAKDYQHGFNKKFCICSDLDFPTFFIIVYFYVDLRFSYDCIGDTQFEKCQKIVEE